MGSIKKGTKYVNEIVIGVRKEEPFRFLCRSVKRYSGLSVMAHVPHEHCRLWFAKDGIIQVSLSWS